MPTIPDSVHRASWNRFINERLPRLVAESLASPGSGLHMRCTDVELGMPWGDPEAWRRKHDSYRTTVSAQVELSGAGGRRVEAATIDLGSIPWLTPAGTFIVKGVERVPQAQLRRRPGVFVDRTLGTNDLPVFAVQVVDSSGARFSHHLTLDRLDEPNPLFWQVRGLGLREFLAEHGLLERATGLFGKAIPELLSDKAAPLEDADDDSSDVSLDDATRAAFNDRLGEVRKALGLTPGAGSDLTPDDHLALIGLAIAAAGLGERVGLAQESLDYAAALQGTRVWLVGDHLEERWLRAMPQLQKVVTTSLETLSQDATGRPGNGWCQTLGKKLSAVLERAFDSYVGPESGLCPPLDRTNPLAEVSSKRALTRLGAGGFPSRRGHVEARDVDPSHYGRLCVLETPESNAIGLRLHLAATARVDETGTLRCDDENEVLGMAAALVPFVAHDELARAGMGAKNMKQAVPLVAPEVALVVTGREKEVARLAGSVVIAEHDGSVIDVTADTIVLDSGVVDVPRVRAGLLGTSYEYRPRVKLGQRIASGTVLIDGPATADGYLALGANVLVAYLSYDGANFEDGIVVSDRLVNDGVFTSRHRWERVVEIPGDEKRQAGRRNADGLESGGPRAGIVWIGTKVREDSVLVRTQRLDAKGRQAAPRNYPLREPLAGTVEEIRIDQVTSSADQDASQIRERITIVIGQERPLRVGDKLTGRHGNKGVVTRIVPRDQMPRLQDGTPIDMLLNPHGVISRMNLGQILETHWGWAARQLRCRFLAAPFRRIQLEHCADPEVRKAIDQILASTDNDEKALQQVLALAEEKTSPPVGTADDTKAKFKLVDPRTEEQLDHAVTVGWQYFMKLNHLAADKVHGREVGDVTRVTMQPVRGRRQGGGQRFGEMELWALLAHHVPALIEETLTLRSDDVIAAQSALSVAGQPTYAPALPESVRALALILRGLLLKLERRDKGGNWSDDWQYLDPNLRVEDVTAVRISPASAADVEKWCGKVAVQEVGDLKRGVEYFCPDHGWWRPEVTRHDLAMMTRQRRVPSHEDRKRERSGRQCPLCSDKPSLERPVWVFSPGGLCDTQAMGGAGDSFSLGATATLPEELKGRSKPAARFSRRDTMALMRLAAPVANPLLAMTACAGAPQSMLRQVLSWETVVDRKSGEWINWASRNREGQAPDYIGGLDLLKEALRNATVAHRLGVEWPDAVWNAAEIAALPIVPPDFRAIWFSDDGAKRPSELHVLYMDVLNANRALKHALESAPQDPKELLICKRRLQRVVNMLFIGGLDKRGDRHQAGSLGDLIQGKQGLLRYALLGKRVNYSGRAVIVGDPDLDLDECRLPRAIVKSAGRFLGRRAQGRNPQEATVLLNRAPSLHRSSVMAFKATEWDEDAIAVPPLVCGAFNADFDGDTMSVFVPLRDEALSEASNKMSPSRHALSAASGKLQLHLAQDIVSATFIASHSDSVARNSLESLLGSLGAGPLDKSGLADLITQIARDSGSKEAAKKAQELLKTVLPALTRWGLSLGIADIPYLAADRRPVRWGKEQIAEVESWCTGQLRSGLSNDNPVSIMVCSGARGDMRSVMQMGALRGTVQGSGDGELVVRGNFREGLSREDFLTSAYGARRTLMDKKLATADAGYLTRLLVECTYGQVVSARDCGTTKGLEVRSFGRLLHAGDPGVDAEAKAPSLASRLVGRVLASPIASLGLKKGQLLNEDLAGLVESAACSSEVVIRSPLTCEQQDGLCQHCYGWDLSTRDFPEIGMPLGVIAAQSVGERGTQLTMRTFHSGGIKTESITSGLPRVRRLLAGKVDMRQLVSADSKQRLEWDLRYAGEPTDLRVLRRKNGQPILKTVRLGRYREALEVLWHGFWWEMAQVYGAAVDARHFEVVLRSLLAGAKKPEDVAISASIRRGDAAHFVADAGFERAISVLAGAAFATDVKKNIGSIDELQRVKSRLMVGKR